MSSSAAGSTPKDRSVLLEGLDTPAPIAGVNGPGRWLVARYEVVSLFSLKSSMATSSVGKTLLVPTPYAVKMALVDAGFRAGLPDEECAGLLESLAAVPVRVAPSSSAVVTHTFTKIRQEPKQRDPACPYISNIAYREMVHCQGEWRWAVDLAAMAAQGADWLATCLPHINYVGKRGSFIQFLGIYRQAELGEDFSQPLTTGGTLLIPPRSHITPLDDFGPEATLAVLSSYSTSSPKRERHRRFVQTVVPLGQVSTGPGFTLYSR
jgi:hypothetical protein